MLGSDLWVSPAGRRWMMVAPAVATLIYPMLLAAVYRSARGLSAATGSTVLVDGVALAASLVITFAVPALALAVASRLATSEQPTIAEARARTFAHLAYA